MPVVTVTLIEGYDEATREELSRHLGQAVRLALDAPPEDITVIVHEVAAVNGTGAGGRPTPGQPGAEPAELVRGYLAAMEARDLEAAGAYLAEGFTMTFPGDVTFGRPEELVAWARSRYRSAAKSYQRIDVAAAEDGAVVYCFGTLAGEWSDGTPFAGIRFIDRFTVAEGKLVDQRVWNDLGEARAAAAT